ncbi:MAG: endonuclease III [Bacillota bacterium]|nr:endonuclease III [Bacillota bacterium]
MTKKEKIFEIRKIFDVVYADADCSLDHAEPLQLLIATQLAAQCTDARVNLITPALFERYPTAADFANADIKELESYIYSTGFYHNKAKNIILCCQMIIDKFDSKIPSSMEELIRLPGVGRKTASIIIGDIYHKPAIVVDTHCKRIAKRIGLTENTDPTKVEFDLFKVVPPDYSYIFCHQLVYHGRAICKSQRPNCAACCVAHLCDKKGVK